jgi:hypothetical protein
MSFLSYPDKVIEYGSKEYFVKQAPLVDLWKQMKLAWNKLNMEHFQPSLKEDFKGTKR